MTALYRITILLLAATCVACHLLGIHGDHHIHAVMLTLLDAEAQLKGVGN